MRRNKWALICYEPITKQATAKSKSVRTSPNSTEKVSSSGAISIEEYTPDAEDGCWVVDKTSMLPANCTWHGGFAAIVYAMPMVDPDLPPGHVRTTYGFNDPDMPLAIEPILLAGGDPLVKLDRMRKASGHASVSYISTDIYAKLYQSFGARVGRVHDGKVVWLDKPGYVQQLSEEGP